MIVFTRFDRNPLVFKDPLYLISTSKPYSIESCFAEMELALKKGYYLAGFMSYEAGYAFEKRLSLDKKYDFPLLHMGVYRAPTSSSSGLLGTCENFCLKSLRLNIAQEDYFTDIAEIRSRILEGQVYQVTYCIKFLFEFSGDPFYLFNKLLRQQPVPYPAYIETEDFQILSLSPEKFIEKRSGIIRAKPMKGTWPRAEALIPDFLERLRFGRDAKNLAENVMIADLLRNDLGRIGRNVAVPRLFEVAGYRTLYQMTSTVTASVAEDISLHSLFSAVFPSGSVTGAPKIRAMEIIRGLEKEERRIYTGAIGYITPQKDLFFNIPIRTALIRNGSGEMGIGGGIIWDSTALGEWQEGMLKASFLTELTKPDLVV
jgi:para-aminobenzoate synthetase/4-amino-4-deoxychorismate lyase